MSENGDSPKIALRNFFNEIEREIPTLDFDFCQAEDWATGGTSLPFDLFEITVKPKEKADKAFDHVRINWLIPRGGILVDPEGKKWVSPLLVTDSGKQVHAKDVPDLGKLDVFRSWHLWARWRWRNFAEKASSGKESVEKATARLEGELNSPWVFGKAREKAGFSVEMESAAGDNELKKAEACRQVNIFGLFQGQGRPRLPHTSHKGVLCPFQTPESKAIGLHLFKAVNTLYDPSKMKIKSKEECLGKGKFLFSLATGLIPYPHHSDGPRLLMGGKNLKQAEPGIAGAEYPLVPGYLEGTRNNRISENSLDCLFDPNEKRFSPPLGVNALVVIMPYAGFTFQDGIVISDAFAGKLAIKRCKRNQKELFKEFSLPAEKGKTLSKDLLNKELSAFASGKNTYSFEDPLPLPPSIAGSLPFRPQYCFRFPGRLTAATLTLEPRRCSRKAEVRRAASVTYTFECDLPMGLGDKLTGRHGNKGVVTRILPSNQMPRIAFGEGKDPVPADLILSPCSVIGRKNLGQIWEMLHGLGLWAIEQDLIPQGLPNKNEDLTPGKLETLFSLLRKNLDMDEHGCFAVSLPGTGRTVQAFAGFQHISRLHHHALDKMQARGTRGPLSKALDQPSATGPRTAQCLGEMENWSILSYPPPEHGDTPETFLLKLRARHKPDKLRETACKCLEMLGHSIDGTILPETEGKDLRAADSDLKKLFHKNVNDLTGVWEIGGEKATKPGFRNLSEIVDKMVQELGPKGNRLDLPIPERKGLTVSLELLQDEELNRSLRKLLRCAIQFTREEGDSTKTREDWEKLLFLLQKYEKALKALVLGKNGLIRRHMVRRRLPNSGRAVIIPAPNLRPDEIYLPRTMIEEIVPKEVMRHLQEYVSTWKDSALPAADRLDSALRVEPAWCLALRQPSLHRHSVQGFRARCWEKPVIGLPPFVTAGFNADFDGDTMAVFFPGGNPDLRHLSIVYNPGLVGTGTLALETGYDLALGWGAIDGQHRASLFGEFRKNGLPLKDESAFVNAPTLGTALACLMDRQGNSGEILAESLRVFQQTLCEASTGSYTFPPLELQDLYRTLEPLRERGKDETRKPLEEALDSPFQKEGSIHALLRLKAKGGPDEIDVMCGALRDQPLCTDEPEGAFITGCLWGGLNDDELFRASYSARDSMASKKLAVAEAGALSRLLAEGLYETCVTGEDCGANEGLTVSYSRERGLLLTLPGSLLDFPFPLAEPDLADTPEKLFKDLARIAWGRVPTGCREGLRNEDLRMILRYWSGQCQLEEFCPEIRENLRHNKGSLRLRSPLLCREKGDGVCSLCMGADPAKKPFDETSPVPVGTCVGLTAAQAIGERGTQLAMRRFHTNTAGSPDNIENLEHLFIKGQVLDRHKSGWKKGTLEEKFGTLLQECLTKTNGQKRTANSDLPQFLVHFELALRPKDGLEERSADPARGGLALLSYGGPGARKVLSGPENITVGKSLKSRITWGDEG